MSLLIPSDLLNTRRALRSFRKYANVFFCDRFKLRCHFIYGLDLFFKFSGFLIYFLYNGAERGVGRLLSEAIRFYNVSKKSISGINLVTGLGAAISYY